MRIIYEKYKHKLIRLPDGVIGVVAGFTHNSFLLSVDDSSIPYCFSLDELGREDYYIDPIYLEECDVCLFTYANESQILKYLAEKKSNQTINRDE